MIVLSFVTAKKTKSYGAREGAATGGDTPGRMRETNRGGCPRSARDDGDKATGPYDDIEDDLDLGAGDAE